MKKKTKLVILHNIISPYRLPLFEELSMKYDLCVYFCKEKTENRLWSTSLENYTFKYKILPSLNIGPLVFNFSLLKELFKNKSDCFIVAENPENAISILTLFVIAKINRGKIILWSERIDGEIFTLIDLKTSNNFFWNIYYNIVKAVYKNYRKYLYSKSDILLPLSSAAENYLKKEGVVKEKIKRSFQIMPESVLEKPTITSKPLEFKNKKVILSLGYLTKGKGVDNLIKAFNQLNTSDTVLLIAGAGEQENNLKKLANNKNIHFLGYVEGIKKANCFSSADFFVFPTHRDVWGFVVNEALYYGLPVISSDRACASELIESGKTGFIVKDNDIEGLAKRMEELLNKQKLLVEMKENVKKMNKSKLVDINTLTGAFEEAIRYTLKLI
jgi:glycosyltransferase involved in cell wall biosynthesis